MGGGKPASSPRHPARWIIRKEEKHLFAAIRSYVSEVGVGPVSSAKQQHGANMWVQPRCAIGLFCGGRRARFGLRSWVPPYVYLERVNSGVIRQLGLAIEDAGRRADVFIRIPDRPEAVFRAAVSRAGLPVTDVLQVWLDSGRPSNSRTGTGGRDLETGSRAAVREGKMTDGSDLGSFLPACPGFGSVA